MPTEVRLEIMMNATDSNYIAQPRCAVLLGLTVADATQVQCDHVWSLAHCIRSIKALRFTNDGPSICEQIVGLWSGDLTTRRTCMPNSKGLTTKVVRSITRRAGNPRLKETSSNHPFVNDWSCQAWAFWQKPFHPWNRKPCWRWNRLHFSSPKITWLASSGSG